MIAIDFARKHNITRRQARRIQAMEDYDLWADAVAQARAHNLVHNRLHPTAFPRPVGNPIKSWLRPRIGKTERRRRRSGGLR